MNCYSPVASSYPRPFQYLFDCCMSPLSTHILLRIKVWYCLFCHFDPSTSNVHNLAMTLHKPDQLWWQNHDLHRILHRKEHLKFFWGALFLGDSPLKIPTFSRSYSERLERGPQCSARRRNFQKLLRTIVVLCIGYNPTGRNDTSSQYPRCLMQKTKKRPFCPTRGWFWVSAARHRGFWEEVSFRIRILQPICTHNSNST